MHLRNHPRRRPRPRPRKRFAPAVSMAPKAVSGNLHTLRPYLAVPIEDDDEDDYDSSGPSLPQPDRIMDRAVEVRTDFIQLEVAIRGGGLRAGKHGADRGVIQLFIGPDCFHSLV
jgi:hypothetical protein